MSNRPITVSYHKHTIKGVWDGKWRLVAEYHRTDARGKRIQKVTHYPKDRGARATETEAKDEAARWAAELNNGKTAVDPHRMTVSQWLEIWLEEVVGLKSTTYQRNVSSSLGKWVMGEDCFLGKMRLQGVRDEHILAWHRSMRQAGCQPGTVVSYHKQLSAALQCAVERGKLAKNPCPGAWPADAQYEIRKMEDVWSTDQIQTFIQQTQKATLTQDRMAVWALYTGMRLNEIIGLKWDDIDWDNQEVRVQRQTRELRGRAVTESGVETNKFAKRPIGLHIGALSVLQDQRKAQMLERAATQEKGRKYHENGLVFADPLGKHRTKGEVYSRFKRLSKELGLPDCRFHALRHCYATLMLGVFKEHVQVVSRALGHKDATVTMQVYAHLMKGMYSESNAQWERFLSNDAGREGLGLVANG